jgi:hypothetical protein
MDIKKTQKTSWWKPYVLDLSFACNSIKAFDLYTNNHSSTLWTHTHTHTYTHTKTTTYDVINTCTGLVCSFSAISRICVYYFIVISCWLHSGMQTIKQKGKHSRYKYIRRVWGYSEQTTQTKEKVQRDKQRSTKHTHKTEDRVTRTPFKTGVELRCSGRVSSSCSTNEFIPCINWYRCEKHEKYMKSTCILYRKGSSVDVSFVFP